MAVTNFVPEVWHATILENFAEATVIANTVAREYEGTASSGNVVHVTSFDRPNVIDYAAGNVSDGSTGTVPRTAEPQHLTDSSQAILINQEKAFSFLVDDIDRRQAAGGMEAITADAAAGLAEDSEEFLAAALLDGGTDSTDAEAVDTGDDAFNLVKRLRTELSVASVKAPLGNRTLLVNPEFSSFLLGADSKLTSFDTAGDGQALRNATIGQLLGFRVVETSLLSPGTPAAVAYHRSAVGYVNQIDTVEALRSTQSFADIIRGLMVYGGRVLRPTAVRYWVAPTS